MIRSKPLISAAMVLCASVFGRDSPEGFSGKWDVDKSVSTASSTIPDGLQQEIKQKKSEIVIKSKWMEPQDGIAPLVFLGVMTTELKLKTDSSSTKRQIGPFMTTSSTVQDAGALVTKWQVNANGEPIAAEWKRTLSPDGSMMTLEIRQTAGNGKVSDARLVFKRR